MRPKAGGSRARRAAIFRQAIAVDMQRAKFGASQRIFAIAGLLQQGGRSRDVACRAGVAHDECAEVRTARGGTIRAAAVEQRTGQGRVACDAATTEVHEAQRGASHADVAVAGDGEEACGLRFVAQHIVAGAIAIAKTVAV